MQKMNSSVSVEVEDLSKVKRRLTITVPAAEVKGEVESVYRSLRSTAAIPGFRKGAVPINVLKARFADQVRDEVTTKLVEGSYGPALAEQNLAPLGTPDLDIRTKDVEGGGDFTYTATFEINPMVEIDGYRGMDVKEETVEVSDEDVEEALKRLAESRGDFKPVDRGAGDDDLLIADFDVFIDGKPLEKARSKDFPIIIGRKTPMPGLDEALKGVKKGEKREVTLAFPENYSEKELAGKNGVFKVKVKDVKEHTVPTVDDEFAKDLECDDLASLRVKVREDIENIKRDNEKERLKNAVLSDIIEKHEIEVPESLENKYLTMLLSRALDNMRSGNPAPGDANKTIDQLKERYAPLAARSVREDIVLDSIADKEKVEVSDDEVEAAVRHLAGIRGVPYDQLMGRIEREGALGVIKDGLRHEKVFDIIFASSKGLKHWAQGAPAPEAAKPKAAAKPKTAAKPKAPAKPKAAAKKTKADDADKSE